MLGFLSYIFKNNKNCCWNIVKGFYPCEDGHLLEVHSDNVVKVVEDPNFKRYELTDEEYASKRDTVKNFKKNMKLGN